DRATGARDDQVNFDIAAQRAAEHVLELRQPLGEIYHRGGQHLPPREGEQLPREALATLGRIHDHVEVARVARVGKLAPQPVHASAHDHQEIVEVVGDAAGQL